MAQFGVGKNPPWARDSNALGQAAVAGVGQPQVGGVVASGILTQPGVATQGFSIAPTQPTNTIAQQFSAQQLSQAVAGLQVPAGLPPTVQLPQPGIAIPTTLATSQVATVSYPTPRAAAPSASPKQRVFTGTVTKLHDNFGFVDEDVFFQTGCVKGVLPKVADRVLVEATYNANMPFKWNATRIQVLPTQGSGLVQPGGVGSSSQFAQSAAQALNFKPPGLGSQQITPNIPASITPSITLPSHLPPTPLMANSNTAIPPVSVGNRGNIGTSRKNDTSASFGRDRDRDRGRDRDRHHERRERRSPRKRSRSPRKSRSPSSRNRSPNRRRGARVVPRYMVQVPKMSLDTREANVIVLRSRYSNLYIPSDFFNAAFSWVDAFPLHRPFTLGKPCNFHVMSKEVDAVYKPELGPDPTDADHLYSAKVMLMASPTLEDLYHKSCALAEDPTENKDNFQHPTRLVQFLVGLKGKSEPMAIGGPWSPSLDGANPSEDPGVLIKTAIRTTKMLTGIDLSACTQWYRFAEIRYHRPEEMHKGRLVPARVETVVIFLPDVWSCVPSRLEWEGLQPAYKMQLQQKIAEENKDETQDEDDDAMDGSEEKKDPTHFSELDPKNMKVVDLRRELECRTLSSKGLKSQLIARLTKALKSEQEKEEQEAETKHEEETEKPEEEEKMEVDEKEEERKRKEEEEQQKKEERERIQRERRYTLPDNPAIIVHPSTTAKSGKFDCTVMSLSLLLDYRPEDNKEHSFEVSLFAELFNEMLMRDYAFRIYKCLLAAPEKKEEDKKHKDKDKKDKKDDKDKSRDKEDKDEDDKEPDNKKRKENDDKDKTKDKKDKRDDGKEDGGKDKSNGDKAEKDDNKDENDKTDKDRRKDKDSKDKDKKREKVKYLTVNRELLLGFVYFDQTHTGYLLDKDVEEIIHTMGLHLSRAQVKKLVQKVVSRDTLNYRKLTDKPVKEESGGEEGDAETMQSSWPLLDEAAVAKGNVAFLPHHIRGGRGTDDHALKKAAAGSESEADKLGEGMVLYKGALVDVSSVMQRLEKSEKTRIAVEDKLRDIQEQMDTLKSNLGSSEKNSQRVTLEVQDLKKKLRDQRKAADVAQENSQHYMVMLAKMQVSLTTLLADVKSTLGSSGHESTDSKSLLAVKKEDSTDSDHTVGMKHEVNGD